MSLLHNEPSPIPSRWSRAKVLVVAIVVGAIIAIGLLALRATRPSPLERGKTSPVQGK